MTDVVLEPHARADARAWGGPRRNAAAQSARINLVSGATDTSYGFAQSLQAAIVAAKAW